jgi:hypothetical protein
MLVREVMPSIVHIRAQRCCLRFGCPFLLCIAAAEAVWKQGRDRRAVGILAAAVAKGWYRAIEPLGQIGPEAAAVVPALKDAQHHRDWRIRKAAIEALRQIER